MLGKAGKPVDRGEWQMNSFTVNAYYEPTREQHRAAGRHPAAAVLRRRTARIAANLGGIGMVIGHELTHGFDDQGAQFDARRQPQELVADGRQAAKFDATRARASPISTRRSRRCRSSFVNGRLTLGENIADLGGVKMAFNAYRTLRKGADKQIVADGFTEDQQFFLAVGQAWCSKDRPAEIQRRLTDRSALAAEVPRLRRASQPARVRDGVPCAAGTPMHPANACSVW